MATYEIQAGLFGGFQVFKVTTRSERKVRDCLTEAEARYWCSVYSGKDLDNQLKFKFITL